MASYTQSSSLTLSNTSYPISVPSTVYIPNTTMYCKLNDTVNFQVNAVQNAPYNLIGIASGALASEPDPGNLGGSSTFSSGKTFTYTWTASSDYFTTWYFFNTGGGAAFEDSISCVIRRVACSLGLSASTISASGGDLTVTVSNLNGLAVPSGNNGHRLYLYVRNSSGTLITSNVSFSTASNNAYLGKITTTGLTSTLTVGSSLPAGTYTVHIGHYGAGGSGNAFYGTDHSITTATFTKSSVTSTVSGLSLGADYNAGTALSAVVTRNSGTITCSPTTFQPTSSVSDQAGSAGAKQRLGGTTNNFSTANLTLNNGESVDFQMTGPAGYSAHTIGRLTIAEDHDDLRIDTGADPGSGGSTGGATASDYGIKITKADGTQIFGTGFKSNVVIATADRPALAHNASETFTVTTDLANIEDDTKIAIVVVDKFTTTDSNHINWPSWTVTRSGNTFTVKNSSGNSRPYRYVVIRI